MFHDILLIERITMLLTQKIRLNPNKIQEEFFVKSCGVARFAYNLALAEWEKQYQKGNTISESALRKRDCPK